MTMKNEEVKLSGLDNPEKLVTCTDCDHQHKFKDRIVVQDDIWTLYKCPKCGSESFCNTERSGT